MVGVALSLRRWKDAGKRIYTRSQQLTPRSPPHPLAVSRVEDWRASFRVRWLIRRFRFGPQSGSHGRVSSPRSPNPACGFPALGSPVGSCISHTEHQGDNGPEVIGFFIPDVGCGGGTAPALLSPSLPVGRPACSRLDNPVHFERGLHPSSGSVPSLGHVMLPGFPAVVRGYRHRHSRDPRPFGHRSSPEAPSLRRHYPASSVVRASPPPRTARPFPRGLSVGACHATAGASRVATIPLFHACRRHYPGGASRCACRSLLDRWQPSPLFRRVGLRVARFEACSAFTRVAARMVAEPPKAARYTEVLQSKSLPPSTAPIATGWSDCCRAGFAPAEGRRLSTAHRIKRASQQAARSPEAPDHRGLRPPCRCAPCRSSREGREYRPPGYAQQ